LLDAPGGSGFDAFRNATDADSLLAISVSPYTRLTVELAVHAAGRKVPIVAITDSEVSPLARIADKTIKVRTASQSFFQTMSAVAAASEILATLIAMGSRKAVLNGLKSSEDYFAAFHVYWKPPMRRNRSSKSD
jgi:DNA-binding MurR/RpiR family transcriptional regulator